MAKKIECRGDLMENYVAKFATLKTEKAKENLRKNFRDQWDAVKDLHKQQNGKVVKDVAVKTADDFLKLYDVLGAIPDLHLEQKGDWTKITGETYKNRKAISALGCAWNGTVKYWYFEIGRHKNYGKFLKAKEG